MLYTLKLGDDCSQEQYDDMRRSHKLDGVFTTAQDVVDDYEATHATARVESITLVVHPNGAVTGKMQPRRAMRC